MKRAALILVATVVAACIPVRPPGVTPPLTPPATMIAHVQVMGANLPIAGALVRLKTALPDTWVEAVTPESGHVLLTVPASLSDTQLQLTAEGWVNIDRHEVVSRDCTLTIQLLARPPPIPPLHTDGATFRTPTGAVWKWHGASAFRMLRQYLDGADLSPVFAWARPLGVNTFRVFTRLSWANLRETGYTDAQLVAFVRLLASQGFRVELVALADCAVPGWQLTLGQQQAHVARIGRVAGNEPNFFGELANEPSHQSNRVDPLAFDKPPGLWSRGSSHNDEAPIIPAWSYLTDHGPRDNEWPRKAKNMAEFTTLGYGNQPALHVPAVGDEPQRIDRAASLVAADHADYAAVAALYAAGSTIHTQSLGKDGVVPTGAEQACAEAIAAAWRDIPNDAQTGTYSRGGLAESPIVQDDATCLRSFAMISGSKAVVVRVRPTDAPQARDGWRIVREIGHIVLLER